MNIMTPENVGFSAMRLSRITTAMQRYVDEGKLAGLLTTVARGGQTVHLEKLGWMDREAKKAMQFDTIFQIASMTKPITAVALMTLYEEGYFTLNTPIYEFILGFKDVKVLVRETPDGLELADLERPVTMRHLFTHTSGLSYGENPDDPVDRLYQKQQDEAPEGYQLLLKDMVEELSHLPLAFQPGTKWRYSLAIDVLGHIVEIISGKALDVFFKERLFEPLGMVDTDFWLPQEKAERLAALYGHPDGPDELKRLDPPAHHSQIFNKPSFLSGGGGLVSTLSDYANFLQMLVNGGELNGVRILSPTTVDLFTINHAPAAALPYGFAEGEDLFQSGYGFSLGTRVLMDVSASGKVGSVGEFGWDGAFNTYFWVDRQKSLYGLLMTQHTPNNYYPLADTFKQLTYQAMIE